MSRNSRNDQCRSPKYAAKVPESICTPDVVETFLTGCPAASIDAFFQGMKEAGMATFSMGITEQLLDARSLWLTPNTTSVYCIAEINAEHGPTVLEVPPGQIGSGGGLSTPCGKTLEVNRSTREGVALTTAAT
jgi:hypothetical protein